MRKLAWLFSLMFVMAIFTASQAGVLSVRVPTKSGIEARFGMIELFTVNWAKNYDFNDDKPDPAWVGDPEGLVRDNYMSHMVYFPVDFVKAGEWRAHVLFSYKASDFDQGKDANYNEFNGVDYDRWRVERAYFEFKLNFLPVNAWLGVGHDLWALDREGGAMVYFDDDPGIRFYGNVDKFTWDMKYIRKAEQTDDADLGTDSNRDILAVKLGYDFGEVFKPHLFFAWDRNGAMSGVGCSKEKNCKDLGSWDVYYIGANAVGKIGAFMYQAEFVWQTGSVDLTSDGEAIYGDDEFDVNAWAALLNFQVDLAQWVPSLNKFVVGLGGVYYSGDDDADDDDLEGFTGVTNAMRFFKPWEMGTLPVHGANQQPVIGSTIYSWNPVSLGVGPYTGGVAGAGGARGDNPGLIAGVFTIDWMPVKKWNIKAMVKYLRWDETDTIEAYYDTDKSIDEEIGWETSLMISYKIYPNVTLFGGISALFPGDGIDDINEVKYGDDDSDVAYHGQLGVKFVF